MGEARCGCFSTRDELVAPGNPLPSGQIYNSHAAILGSAAEEAGAEVLYLGIAVDKREAVIKKGHKGKIVHPQ
ncbi:hypothetical protein [Entomobacter blattae]|uniref:Uncharacterized protein n=1 Tax=Entomobacter blattae TaxID=2762277 RepID=A0A7H1NQV2_9PROT|nr:hypothetical protein [Entomobacter blattae]QNT78162.1 hypothetical protein JGUZn3_09300 [Entomobacter blattae]